MKNEHEKKLYTTPVIKVIKIHCQTKLLGGSKNAALEELGLAENKKEFWA